jgi:hypothetical protein
MRLGSLIKDRAQTIKKLREIRTFTTRTDSTIIDGVSPIHGAGTEP